MDQQPQLVWRYFQEISQIPRPSKHEKKISDYLMTLAQNFNFECKTDEVGNVYIFVPASQGYQGHKSIMIQNHMDMVCDSLPQYQINFFEQPIKLVVQDGWVRAQNTTLGADNGIGMAVALALATDEQVAHPALELVFTVDEETGLNGAQNLRSDFIKSERMLNFDSEDWGSFYIGCAGGMQIKISGTLTTAVTSVAHKAYYLRVGGLIGGHSGIDIHRQRGNALKILADLLLELQNAEIAYQLHGINGGKAHNIIPRDAFAVITLNENEENLAKILSLMEKSKKQWESFLPSEEKNFSILLEGCKNHQQNTKVLIEEDKKRLLNLLNLLPHGVSGYCLQNNGGGEQLPSLSSNMAICKLHDEELSIECSIRFFNRNHSARLLSTFQAASDALAFTLKKYGEYPGWEPEFINNPLLDQSLAVYKKIFPKDLAPKVLAIHAGLECGIIKGRFSKKIDAISLGPNIRGAHSPDERVEIASVDQFWIFARELLKSL